MKKLVLMMVGFFLISTANAQEDKEALKAQKEAQKEAEHTLKKARTTYELSIPNPQYGRKETDFEKLGGALPLIQSARENEYTVNNMQTWRVSADIEYEYNKKLDNEVKADPDNSELMEKYVESCANLVTYCIKFDSLMQEAPKVKADEKKTNHERYRNMATNPAIQLLQASQGYSNGESEDSLKKGLKYSELFSYAMEKSSLMSDFKNEKLDEWKTYAKAFRAQSLLNMKGTSEETIVNAYKALMGTTFKANAYQSLVNYYRDKDQAKQNQYLQEGIEALKGDAERKDLRANFAIMLMQSQFQKGDKEGFKKTAALVKSEFSDNDNAINAYLMEGQMAFEDKNFDEAKAIFLAAKEKFPDEPKTLLMAARSAWMKAQNNGSKKEDMEEAIKLFRQLEDENADDPDLWGESLYVLYNNTNQTALRDKYKKYYNAGK